jgi:hypothetical protein
VNLPSATTVQQQPQPVIVEVTEALADPLHLLDQQVDGLGGPVGAAIGGMPSKDLGLPGPYGVSQAGQLSDLDAINPAVEAIQGRAEVGCRTLRGFVPALLPPANCP